MTKVAIDYLVDQVNGLVGQLPDLFRQPGQIDKIRELALACSKSMIELGDQNRAEAIPVAVAGAELFLALIKFASPQPDWVEIHEELCCRYGAIWIVDLISEGCHGSELWRDQGIDLLKRLCKMHDASVTWIPIKLAFLQGLPAPTFPAGHVPRPASKAIAAASQTAITSSQLPGPARQVSKHASQAVEFSIQVPRPANQRLKIMVVGNCQAYPLLIGMQQKLTQAEISFCPSVHLATADDVANLHRELANTDALVMHRVLPGYRNDIGLDSPCLRALLPEGSSSFVLPNLHYEGYFPWTTYAQDPDGLLPALEAESPLGPYHDFLAMAAAQDGLDYTDLMEYRCTPQIADLLLNAHAQSLDELSSRESDCDVGISDWIAANFRNIPLAHTINHPTQATLDQLLRRLLAKLNTAHSLGPELFDSTEYLGDLSIPIHPWVRQALRLGPWACQWGQRRKEPFRIEAQLSESIAFYRRHSWMALANENHPKLKFAKACLSQYR
jgi:hypothetical protein